MMYYAHRLNESDLLWVGTKSVGARLLMYADAHGGEFPATLEDARFAVTLDPYAEAYLRHLRPTYTPPMTNGVGPARLLVAHTRWETVTFYSDGNTDGSTR